MAVSYNRLWVLLKERNIYRSDLTVRCGISPNTISRMGKGLSVSVDVLERLCIELDCEIGDIVEIKK